MRRRLLAATLMFLGLSPASTLRGAEPPTPPGTQICEPTQLITAEAFDRPESLAPKGQPGWRGGIGTWHVADGTLHAKEEAPSSKRPNGHEGVCEYVTEFTDAVIAAEFKLGSSPQIGFVCRDTQQPNHHLGRVLVTRDAVWLQQMSGIGKQTKKLVLQRMDTEFDPDTWYSIVIEICGDRWMATVGSHRLEGQHGRFKETKGRVGMVAKGEGAQFRNVAVWHAQPKP